MPEVLDEEKISKPASKLEDKAFMALARERFKLSAEASEDEREKALDDFKFRIGEQWPDEIKKVRQAQKLPCLTINRIPRTIAQVTNEQRQQRPAGQINPVGDGADVETAEVMQGVIRHIEVRSDGDYAKDTAFDHMVTGGFGYIGLLTEYVDEESDDQEIALRAFDNAFAVYGDPYETFTRPADFYFITQFIKPEEYKRLHPDSDLAGASIDSWPGMGDSAPGWISSEGVRVAEYFWVEEVEGKRKPKRTVHWVKINGIEELGKRTSWLVDEIPIFKVRGEELIVDGKKHSAGLVRYAKDPARMYNVWVSAATTMIGMAPKPKYIAAAGQIDAYKAQWEKANQSDLGVLVYDPIDNNGTPEPPPHLETFEPPIQAIQLMVHQSDNDFKATTGIYDAALGQKGPDESGKAILARQKQTDIATLNYSDNLSRTLLKMYRHMLKLIPKVYSERTVMRIIKPDGTTQMVPVNDAPLQEGVKRIFDLRTGIYDVEVTVGPSYQTKRQEAVSTQLELAKSMPIVGTACPDIMIGNMDIPQAKEMAARVKLMLPPQILQAENQDPNQLPQLHAQLTHATQQIQLLSKVNEELLEKAKGHEAQNAAKVQIEQMKGQNDVAMATMKHQAEMTKAELDAYVKITVAEITTKAQNAQTRAQLESEELQELHGSAHEAASQAVDHLHERMMADKSHQQALEQSAQGNEQALQQGDQSHQQALEQDEQGHAQKLEQGEQGHAQALEQGEQSGQQQKDLAAQAAENSGGEGE